MTITIMSKNLILYKNNANMIKIATAPETYTAPAALFVSWNWQIERLVVDQVVLLALSFWHLQEGSHGGPSEWRTSAWSEDASNSWIIFGFVPSNRQSKTLVFLYFNMRLVFEEVLLLTFFFLNDFLEPTFFQVERLHRGSRQCPMRKNATTRRQCPFIFARCDVTQNVTPSERKVVVGGWKVLAVFQGRSWDKRLLLNIRLGEQLWNFWRRWKTVFSFQLWGEASFCFGTFYRCCFVVVRGWIISRRTECRHC